jgi:hypothetical protein
MAMAPETYMLDGCNSDDEDDRLLALTPRRTAPAAGMIGQRKVKESKNIPKLVPTEEIPGWETVIAKTKSEPSEKEEDAKSTTVASKANSPTSVALEDSWEEDFNNFDCYSAQKATGAAKYSKGSKSKQFKAAKKRGYASDKRMVQSERSTRSN